MKDDKALILCEEISALADGRLSGSDFVHVVEAMAADDAARATWHDYHLIGDILRRGEQAAVGGGQEFLSRFQARMLNEPLLAEPLLTFVTVQSGSLGRAEQLPANDAIFRWKLVAGLASLVAVVAIAWTATGELGPASSSQQLAQARSPMVATVAPMSAQPVISASGESQVMLRDPRLDELLAAHKQFGGTSALQMPAGFLRNATFETPSR